MAESIKTPNVNSSYFDGHYKNIWRQIFPEKTTQAEVDFIVADAGLNSRSNILDLMCGYGRHAVPFARRNIKVTAIDNLCDYINEIKDISRSENLPIETLCEDVLEMQIDQQYDAVICMGNSLQFFNDEEIRKLLLNITDHLKSGGRFYINTWSIAEIALKNLKEKTWSRFGNLLFLADTKLLFHPTRMETSSLIIADSGEREEKKGIDYIYSISELEGMLNKAGFDLKEIYSIPGKKVFTVGEPRAYIVAEKIDNA